MKRASGGGAQIPEHLISWAKGLDEAMFAKWLPSFAKSMGIPEEELLALFDRAPAGDGDGGVAAADPRIVRGKVMSSRPRLGAHEREMIERAGGTFRADAPNWPHRDAYGNYIYPTVTPTEHRKNVAARQVVEQEKIVAQMRREESSK